MPATTALPTGLAGIPVHAAGAQPVSASGPACRPGCGACCTAPSISSAIPGMPEGKPAGVPCVQLDAGNRCSLFGHPSRPAVCRNLQPSAEMCGSDQTHALHWLARLEAATAPQRQPAAGTAAATWPPRG